MAKATSKFGFGFLLIIQRYVLTYRNQEKYNRSKMFRKVSEPDRPGHKNSNFK